MTKRKRHNISGETSEGDAQAEHEKQLRVQVGPVGAKGVSINGHPCKDGDLVVMYEGDIDNHRSRGIALLDVPDDVEGEHIDTTEPYVAPETQDA